MSNKLFAMEELQDIETLDEQKVIGELQTSNAELVEAGEVYRIR